MSNHDDIDPPLPSFLGVNIPRDIEIDNDEAYDAPSRRATGAVVFNEPLLQASGPVSSTGPLVQSAPGKSVAPSLLSSKSSIHYSSSSSHSDVKKTSALSPPAMGWTEKQLENVPTLPAFCTLEPSAAFVPNASVRHIAARVATVLRERSMEARFDHSKASCTTLEGVDFCIRFYRGREPRYSHGIIVEVQRRYGTSLSFHADITAILDAATNKSSPSSSTSATNHLPVVSDTEEDAGPSQREGRGTLNLVSKMFQHPETHRLALETLVTFTNETKMGTATARKVSRELLEPGSGAGAKLVSLIIVDNNRELRAMAMEALGNALQNRDSTTGVLRIPVSKLRSVLQQDLLRCERSPRTAYLAARCLEQLLENGEHDVELYQALETTLTVGQARHMALAQQSEKCLQRFAAR